VVRVVPGQGVGVSGLGANQDLNLYPNPNNGNFILSVPRSHDGLKVEIAVIDLNGRAVFHRSFSGNSDPNGMRVDLEGLQDGMYVARVTIGQETSAHRLVIQKN
jgi:hypothetical protein